ncbi:MAG TPA: type IV pilus secretin PilQ [Vicinamibacterales bacterium]|nr:type IV pilus secretin PilQ [Vicinamibacterales bacterium]
MYRHSLLLGLSIAAFVLSPLGVAGTRTEGERGAAATLRKVTSQLDAQKGILSIEASAPVAYVASQPDARTTIVEMRNVAAGSIGDVTVDQRHPIDAVKVESVVSPAGESLARVLITFRQPARPRIRSSRNVIFVEADRIDPSTSLGAGPSTGLGAGGSTAPSRTAMGPKLDLQTFSPAIRDLRVTQRGTATAITLLGTAPLVASGIQEPKDAPRRIVLNLPQATSAIPTTMRVVREGPVERVRVSMSPAAPFGTQVTMELSRAATYRLESSADGNDLSVVFDEPAADPIAALRSPVPLAAAPLQAPAPAPPVVAAPQQPAAPLQVEAGQRQFTGTPVSLDFDGTDLRAVLTALAKEGGINIWIDPRVQGTVTTTLTDVPWDEAFDIIASGNGLGYVQRGSVVRVVPLAVLAEEEAARRKVEEERALAGELRTYTKSLSYATAKELATLVKDTVLSPRGQVQVDDRTNTLIVTDLVDRLGRTEDLISKLDVPQPQVEIEARIVQTSRDFARQIGVNWGVNARASTDLANTTGLTFPNQGSISGRTGSAQGPDGVPTVVDQAVTNPSSAIGLALGSINGAINLDIALSALERSGKGKILSTPRVSTQNNVQAEIMQGVQIPIQTVANNTVTVTWKDAALILRVLPQITAANTVIMKVELENGSPDFARAIENNPPINTQRALTSVRVANGDTTVIGGIFLSTEQATQSRTPGLSKVPLLGLLFRRDEVTDESRELLIFITPRIIQ